jgi:Fe-S cluster biogenesis protein NfuA
MSNEIVNKIKQVVDKDIRSFIEADGGRIHFVDYSDGVVRVKLSGACTHCAAIEFTLKGGIEKILMLQVPEVQSVELA